VEDIFLKIKTEDPFWDQKYISTGYKNVEAEIRKRLSVCDQITIESTGIALQFKEMVSRLKKDYSVKLVKIKADSGLCLRRINSRDQSQHIAVSDDKINEINKRAQSIIFDYDLVIDNNTATDDEIIKCAKTCQIENQVQS
jgi:peptide subunit release factor RF-3